MTVAFIISLVSIILSLSLGYALYKMHKHVEEVTREIGAKFSDMDIDKKLSGALSKHSTQSIDEVAKTLFKKINEKYTLSAKSYFELVENIKNNPKIEKEKRELYEDFFNDIIHISYRDVELSGNKREELKQKTKVIIRTLE